MISKKDKATYKRKAQRKRRISCRYHFLLSSRSYFFEMTHQFWCKFIFVFGFLQFVPRVHGNDAGECRNTNVLERAFGNVLTTRFEKQTKATEEMFEIKLVDHRDELSEMLDTKQEEQRHQIGNDIDQVLDAKFKKQRDGVVQVLDQQKDGFVQLLEDKFETQKNDFIQLLQTALERQKENFEQKFEDQKERNF